MNIAEILRKLADLADNQADPGRPDPGIQNPAELVDVQVVAEPSDTDSKDKTPAGNDKEPEIFLPPLQQKQELLKKAVGVENIYDDGTPEEQAEEPEKKTAEDDAILARMKAAAGISPAVVQELSNDEVFDD
jgi:hypothetical protein